MPSISMSPRAAVPGVEYGVAIDRGCLSVSSRTDATTLTASTQSHWFSYFKAPKTFVAKKIGVATAGTAAGATPTLIRMGLWSLVKTATGWDATLVDSTPNDTTLLAATDTLYEKALSGGNYTIEADKFYGVSLLVVTAAAAPTVQGTTGTTGSRRIMGYQPVLSALYSGVTDLPASVSASAVAGNVTPILAILAD